MKKIIITLLAVLMLTACAKKESGLKVANADDAVILNNGKVVYTQGDYIDALQYADNTQTFVIAALNQIAANEGIDLEEKTAEQINYIKEMLGDYYENYVTSNAGSVEFYEASVRADIAYSELATDYVETNITSLADSLAPRRIQVASFEEKEVAEDALARIKAGEQFDAVCFELAGEQDTIKPYVITEKDSTLDKEVKSAVLEAKGLTDIIEVNKVTTLSTGESNTVTTYFIANVLSTTYTDFADEFKELAAGIVSAEELFDAYFAKYNFEMFNTKAYLDMRNNYPTLVD